MTCSYLLRWRALLHWAGAEDQTVSSWYPSGFTPALWNDLQSAHNSCSTSANAWLFGLLCSVPLTSRSGCFVSLGCCLEVAKSSSETIWGMLVNACSIYWHQTSSSSSTICQAWLETSHFPHQGQEAFVTLLENIRLFVFQHTQNWKYNLPLKKQWSCYEAVHGVEPCGWVLSLCIMIMHLPVI